MTKEIKPKWTQQRINFVKTYGELDDSETLKEILFTQKCIFEKLEQNRSNTSKLVWWLIAIPIIFFLFAFVFGLGGLAASI
ncbi:hypothetical protein N1F78_11600 [Seonamhaeicola sp. MEBiC1930]|uniref:hypothetical protein n=1 Tax=Seonamhaeicola sp. MEBiC01930 TaxID=2976768 RepID=UPI0032454BF1